MKLCSQTNSEHCSISDAVNEKLQALGELVPLIDGLGYEPLVSLFGLFVARGNRRADRQTKYCNPRCACVPRVST